MKFASWICRIAFGIVFVLNVMCALQFVLFPAEYVNAYELTGTAGEVAIQGLGVAFLMWNATYPLFVVDPVRFQVLGIVIVVQQLIGAIGETLIYCSLDQSMMSVLCSSISRFMVFDYAGLVVMAIALFVFRRAAKLRGGAKAKGDLLSI